MVETYQSPVILVSEPVAKSIKALNCEGHKGKEGNHEGHEEHKEELFFSLVAFVSFVVQGFYALCDTLKWKEEDTQKSLN